MHVLKNNFARVWKLENYSNSSDLRLCNYDKGIPHIYSLMQNLSKKKNINTEK